MTRFVAQTSWARGEIDPLLHARQDGDFYEASAGLLDNFLPDGVSGISTRPNFQSIGKITRRMAGTQFGVSAPIPVPGGGLVWTDPIDVRQEYTLLPEHQHLYGFSYQGQQALIHAALYTRKGDGLTVIGVTPYLVFVEDIGGMEEAHTSIPTPALAPGSGVTGENPIDAPLNTAMYAESPSRLNTKLTAGAPIISDAFSPGDDIGSILQEISFATAGPAVFVAHRHLKPTRVYITRDGQLNIEFIKFYRELFGLATIDATNKYRFNGNDDALFDEQLSPGDKVRFHGQFYTVANTGVYDDPNEPNYKDHWFEVEEEYLGTSFSDRVDVPEQNPFGESAGNPQLVAFYQGRLVLAASRGKPTGLWMSRSGDPYTIVPSGVADDSPVNIEILADGADRFTWMTGGDRLYVGSSLGEYAVGTTDETLTPTQLRFFRIGNTGGAPIQPVSADGMTLFVSRSRSQLVGVVYDLGRQAFSTSNLSLLGAHLTRNIKSIAFRPPTSFDRTARLFVIDKEGLRALALAQTTGVAAWSRISHSPAFRIVAAAGTSEYLFAVCVRKSGLVDLAVLRNG